MISYWDSYGGLDSAKPPLMMGPRCMCIRHKFAFISRPLKLLHRQKCPFSQESHSDADRKRKKFLLVFMKHNSITRYARFTWFSNPHVPRFPESKLTSIMKPSFEKTTLGKKGLLRSYVTLQKGSDCSPNDWCPVSHGYSPASIDLLKALSGNLTLFLFLFRRW